MQQNSDADDIGFQKEKPISWIHGSQGISSACL